MPSSPDDRSFPSRPFLGASIAVWKGGEVLLARRGKAPSAGLWSLPGGLVELGERASEAALRELMEETGVTAEIVGLVDVVDIIGRTGDGRIRHHYALACYAARHLGGEARAGDDAAAVAWASPDALAAFPLTEGTDTLIRRSRALVER